MKRGNIRAIIASLILIAVGIQVNMAWNWTQDKLEKAAMWEAQTASLEHMALNLPVKGKNNEPVKK